MRLKLRRAFCGDTTRLRVVPPESATDRNGLAVAVIVKNEAFYLWDWLKLFPKRRGPSCGASVIALSRALWSEKRVTQSVAALFPHLHFGKLSLILAYLQRFGDG